MFIYTNPNPIDKKVGDCVIRAIAIATETTWERAYMDLCMEGLEMADLPNSNAVWASYLKKLGFRKGIVPDTCPDCYTVADFAEDNPYGVYVLCTGSFSGSSYIRELLQCYINGNNNSSKRMLREYKC